MYVQRERTDEGEDRASEAEARSEGKSGRAGAHPIRTANKQIKNDTAAMSIPIEGRSSRGERSYIAAAAWFLRGRGESFFRFERG